MLKRILLIGVLTASIYACKSESQPSSSAYYEILRSEITGDIAYNTTAYVEQFWRIAGNSGFNKSIDHIIAQLEASGYIEESKSSSSDRLTYRIETYAMDRPTWEPIDAKITFADSNETLLDFTSNRNLININSAATPIDGLQLEVTKIDSLAMLDEMNVEGKLVYAQMHPYRLYQKAVTEGKAAGIITYSNPAYLQPKKNKTSIQFRSIPYKENSNAFGISLSYEANEKLNKKLKSGKVTLDVNIQTKQYGSDERTLVANIKGSVLPQENLVFSAHVQEPGANDNASGVGAQLEMAVVMGKLISQNQLDVNRTLTFLWGDEIVSTRRYVKDSTHNNPKTKWGISLDMVGENTAITGGSFLIEKMPDPSAIWTRGNDKHTEWGGRPLGKDDMTPHYLNDFVISIFEEQADFANWEVNTNPYEGGSDHVPFLRNDIPSVLFWHFTDQFYHTDNDRIDKVSKETLQNVATSALVSALELINSNNETAINMVNLIEKKAILRLTTEAQLGQKNLKADSILETEIDILDTWKNWYLQSLNSISDLEPDDTERLLKFIEKAKQRVNTVSDSLTLELQKQR